MHPDFLSVEFLDPFFHHDWLEETFTMASRMIWLAFPCRLTKFADRFRPARERQDDITYSIKHGLLGIGRGPSLCSGAAETTCLSYIRNPTMLKVSILISY